MYKVPKVLINDSNRAHNVKMALEDRMKREEVGQPATHDQCNGCKTGSVVGCCSRMFHCSSIAGVFCCPFCCEPWKVLPCVKCGQSKHDREPHLPFMKCRRARMPCCWVDNHPRCKKQIVGICSACEEELDRVNVGHRSGWRRWGDGCTLTADPPPIHMIISGAGQAQRG